MQETKADEEQIDEALRAPEGYKAWYHSCRRKKGYSGVVVYSKIEPKRVNFNLGIEKFDEEGRIIELEFEDFVLFNIYFPNGTSGQDRVDYKLEFYDAVFNYCEALRKEGKNVIITGDYNIAHHPIDLARPKANENNSGFLPVEREKLDWIEELGYVDSFRNFCDEPEQYTWWSNRGRARENNIGWRIDYFYVNKEFMPRVTNTYHQPEVEGSDHCPIILELQ
jgi:exodeoxyribonuclease-3